MSRTFSAGGYDSLMSRANPDVWVVLLTIAHPTLTPSFYLVNDNVATTSRGQLFSPYPFDIVLADDTIEGQPVVNLIIDNVDRLLVDTIRRLTSPPSITIEIVRADYPNTVELTVRDLILRLAEWNALKITGNLEIEDVNAAKFPSVGATFNPRQYPGLF